ASLESLVFLTPQDDRLANCKSNLCNLHASPRRHHKPGYTSILANDYLNTGCVLICLTGLGIAYGLMWSSATKERRPVRGEIVAVGHRQMEPRAGRCTSKPRLRILVIFGESI